MKATVKVVLGSLVVCVLFLRFLVPTSGHFPVEFHGELQHVKGHAEVQTPPPVSVPAEKESHGDDFSYSIQQEHGSQVAKSAGSLSQEKGHSANQYDERDEDKHQMSTKGTNKLLAEFKQFLDDPSFSARCKETIPPLKQCPPHPLLRKAIELPELIAATSPGQTTKDMALRRMSDVLGKDIVHHPIFNDYARRTYVTEWLPKRVIEFVGVHTDYDYDCEQGVDFRDYHQVRTAMCLEYEEREKKAQAGELTEQLGMFPLVDEEYFEIVMTLTTARQAAMEKTAYTFIELGARYGTWVVRAGAAFRTFSEDGELNLLAVEGNCGWFQKMKEHVACNKLEQETKLILAYAAPTEYNKVVIGKPSTYKEPRAVSMLQMLSPYSFVDMIDFDIQGFEWLTISERGAFQEMTNKVGFLHVGTHSTDIEKTIISHAQTHGWCVVYFFAGAHTKKLNKGHRCQTPFGPSGFNDGVLGLANMKYYTQFEQHCKLLDVHSLKKTARTCYWVQEAERILFRRAK